MLLLSSLDQNNGYMEKAKENSISQPKQDDSEDFAKRSRRSVGRKNKKPKSKRKGMKTKKNKQLEKIEEDLYKESADDDINYYDETQGGKDDVSMSNGNFDDQDLTKDGGETPDSSSDSSDSVNDPSSDLSDSSYKDADQNDYYNEDSKRRSVGGCYYSNEFQVI